MSHSPADSPETPSAEDQVEGASAAPSPGQAEINPYDLREQLLKEFTEKCIPYKRTLALVLKDSALSKAMDLYGFLVFDVGFSFSGSEYIIGAPSFMVHYIARTMPSVKIGDIRSYSMEFDQYKIRSARNVIEACEKLGKKKLKRHSSITAEAISSMYELGEKKDDIDAQRVARDLMTVSVREYIDKWYELLMGSPHSTWFKNLALQVFEGIDRGPLFEIIAKEIRKIARLKLGAKKEEAIALTTCLIEKCGI